VHDDDERLGEQPAAAQPWPLVSVAAPGQPKHVAHASLILEVDALGQLCRPLGAMQLGQCQALGAAPLVQCGPEAPLERWRPRHARELVAMVILVVAVLVGSVGLPAALLEEALALHSLHLAAVLGVVLGVAPVLE